MKKLFIITLFVISYAVASFSAFSETLNIEKIEKHFNILAAQAPGKVITLIDFLNYVNNEAPEYFANYSLVYKSNSIQSGTALNPRAVLYGNDAKFVFTFNGDKSQKGFDDIEISQFRENGAKFEFYSIHFSESKPVISQPTKCLTCHGENSKPIWRDFPSWEGVYGSTEDNIEESQTYSGEKEELFYAKYLAHAVKHERYQYLNERLPVSECQPLRKNLESSSQDVHIDCRPNFRLSVLFADLDSLAVNRVMKSKPNFEINKYIMALLATGGMKDGYLYSSWNTFPGKCLEKDIDPETAKSVRSKIENYFIKNGTPLYKKFKNESVNLFFTAANLGHLDFSFFDAYPDDGFFKFNWLSNQHLYLTSLYESLIVENPELKPFYVSYSADSPLSVNGHVFSASTAPISKMGPGVLTLNKVGAFEDGACRMLRKLTMIKIGEKEFAEKL